MKLSKQKKNQEATESPQLYTEIFTPLRYFLVIGTQLDWARRVTDAKRRGVWLVADENLINPYQVIGVGESFYLTKMGSKRVHVELPQDLPLY